MGDRKEIAADEQTDKAKNPHTIISMKEISGI